MDDFLRFPSAVKHETTIDLWLQAQRAELRPFVETWFARMRACGDDVGELMHDGCPTACVDDAGFAYVNAYKAHVNVGFFRGALLRDPAGLLEGTGKRGRHVKLRPGEPVNEAALARLIKAAYAEMKAHLRKSDGGRAPSRVRPTRSASEPFRSVLFRYPGPGGWTFAPVPASHAPTPTSPWGRTPVWATVDGVRYATSVWRDRRHGTLLPVPKAVRGTKEGGTEVAVSLEPRAP